MVNKLRGELNKLANPQKAKIYQGFFKTGKGEYGEGDVFLGLSVPESRKIAIKYKDLSFDEIKKLLLSKIHEERLISLLILVYNYEKGTETDRNSIYNYYLKNSKYINNWDLVDLSADKIVGQYLLDRSEILKQVQDDTLVKLARSKNMWERRISIIATYQFIKDGRYQETLTISKMLLNDHHDLIHKAVGWMLREVGKNCSEDLLEGFLNKHYQKMPRTMLRYAIERFPENLRRAYLDRSKIPDRQ